MNLNSDILLQENYKTLSCFHEMGWGRRKSILGGKGTKMSLKQLVSMDKGAPLNDSAGEKQVTWSESQGQ